MENKLETYIKENKLDEAEAMNILEDNGIISDGAIWAKDVATKDEDMAIKFLTKHNETNDKQTYIL